MPRDVTWGTPGRSEHYPPLRPRHRLVVRSLVAGAAALALFLVFQATGLREPLSPGSVTSAHAIYDARCEACHAPRRGASDLRCQRCHDTGGAGRLTQGAHVFFGSGDAQKAAAAGSLACARCHVEHRGAGVALAAVDQAQCLRCHDAVRPAAEGLAFRIGSFRSHPEFAVLRQKLEEAPGLLFSHKRHMREMIKEGAPGEWQTCVRCHSPQSQGRGRDLEPIDFDRHCARCHMDALAMLPVPEGDVEEDPGLRGARGAFQKGFGGIIVKTDVRHKDEWLLYNIRKLQWELYPEAYARDRGLLDARASQLERRLAQTSPLVGLALPALERRRQELGEEVRRLEARLRTQASGAGPASGLTRLGEVVAAVRAAGAQGLLPAAEQARDEGAALEKVGSAATPLAPEAFEDRRRELLAVLDALGAADPQRQRTVEDLRRRLLALSPGEPGRSNLERALAQRRSDLARVQDEIVLRRSGVSEEVRTLPETAALQRELDEVRGQLAKFYRFTGAPPPLPEVVRAGKQDSLRKLTGAGEGERERCAKCHLFDQGSLRPVRAARPILVRAAFAHARHLNAPLPEPGFWDRLLGGRSAPAAPDEQVRRRYRCAYCHDGIEKAGDAPRRPSLPSLETCRGCHQPRSARQDCGLCHRYHPPGAPA